MDRNKSQVVSPGEWRTNPIAQPGPSSPGGWREEVQRNMHAGGIGGAKDNPEYAALEAFSNRPSPRNFSGGAGWGGGFGPDSPKNVDEYWRRVAREPHEVADANRARALPQQQPFDMSWEGTVKRAAARGDARVRNTSGSAGGNPFAPRDEGASPDAFKEWLSQVRAGGQPQPDGASPFDTSFSSILQLLED